MARKKRKREDEHVSEAWLIPYSDILTLLLALFVVLYASSQVDQKKFDALAESLNVAFNVGNTAVLENVNSQPQITTGPRMSSMDNAEAYAQETTQLMAVQRQIDQYIRRNNLAGDLQSVMTEDGLLIRIKDTALFPSGSAALLPEARRVGAVVAKMLVALPQKVIVSGHTDNVPIHTAEFPSNWDLSAKRALNFMKFILTQEKLQPARFSAIGYGEYHPITTNDTVEGRSKNRRVEILIARTYRQR